MEIKDAEYRQTDNGGNPYAPLPDNMEYVPELEDESGNTVVFDVTKDTVPDGGQQAEKFVKPDPIAVTIVDENQTRRVRQLRTFIMPIPANPGGVPYRPFELIGAMPERKYIRIENHNAAGGANLWISEDAGCNPAINGKLLEPGEFVELHYGGRFYGLVDGATRIEVMYEYEVEVAVQADPHTSPVGRWLHRV